MDIEIAADRHEDILSFYASFAGLDISPDWDDPQDEDDDFFDDDEDFLDDDEDDFLNDDGDDFPIGLEYPDDFYDDFYDGLP